jgi:hypothetical protein
MRELDVRVMVSSRGVSRVQAMGRDSLDRQLALAFITRIVPILEELDRVAKDQGLVLADNSSEK